MKNQKENILFILADDMGAWAMGCAGNTEIHTPNLDKLAAKGMRFENFFCASPVCSPARASILTGRMPSAHGVHDWLRGGNHVQENQEKYAISYLDGMTTYPDLLHEADYQLALSGKWHVGDSFTPQHHFEKWYTLGGGGCAYMHPDMVENGNLTYENRYVTDIITDKAIDFLDSFEKERPFYLSVHYTAPHSPWEEEHHPKEFINQYRDCEFLTVPDLPYHKFIAPTAPKGKGEERKRQLRGYFAAITAMDAAIGRIVEHLEKKKLLDTTTIVFMSDNGMNMGHHGIWGKGNGTFPANMYDTSVKVPMIVSAPGRIAEGIVVSEMASQIDLLPTIAAYLGKELPANEYLGGKNLLPLLENKPFEERDTVVVFDEYGSTRMIRTKTKKFVYRHPYGPNEFYDLESDPNEEKNRVKDPVFREEIEALTVRLYRWFDEQSDPTRDGKAEGVTGFGQLRQQGQRSDGKTVWYLGEDVTFFHDRLKETEWTQ